ncbi:MAG TPA: hypothetical protein VNT60_00145 [Deinococcales bacterium]|nr:hypothetical protein [Deinococcales bacterium]
MEYRWVRVCTGTNNGPVIAAALDSLGISPKLTTQRAGTYDVWVREDHASEASKYLGKTPGAGWAQPDARVMGSLAAMYGTATTPDGNPL